MHGLVHRQYREHPEATRCFQMALRNCPKENKDKWLQLLKELAIEQVMSGDYRGFVVRSTEFIGFLDLGTHHSRSNRVSNTLMRSQASRQTGCHPS